MKIMITASLIFNSLKEMLKFDWIQFYTSDEPYSRKNFHDLAIEQFSLLKNEIQVMDERKKDAIYELGCCFESMGDQDKAIEEFKVVYSA
jgi:hypothetical protein